jgi:hypothetical protein
MISKIIYKELPIEDIAYLNREEFSEKGQTEKAFYQNLKQSIAKHGIKDPVYIVLETKLMVTY